MLEITNWKVYDLNESIIACRNAMRTNIPEYTEEEFQKGLARAKKLVKANNNKRGITCHANFRTGIRVSFDLKYSQYITKQLQRYHWLDYVSSSSLMHKIVNMDFDKCCNKYVSRETIEHMKDLICEYSNILAEKPDLKDFECVAAEDTAEELYKVAISSYKHDLYEAWMRIVSNCPMGCELFVRVSTNYEQLATIYRQRKNHKLKEDWGTFIEFIKQLPYAKELIIGDYEDENS